MFAKVLFDLDGTLVNTIPDIAGAVNSALVYRGIEPVTNEEMKKFVGRGLRNALLGAVRFKGAALTDEETEELYGHLMEHYREHVCDESHPYPGVPRMLEKIQAAGVDFGIFSSKEGELIGRILEKLFPSIRFSFVEGRAGRYPAKPDPSAVFAFLGSERPSNLLYVGDSEVDYETAKNAGTELAMVGWGFRSPSDLRALGAEPIEDIAVLEKRILEG